MKKLEIMEMEDISGGVTCSQAAGWLFGGGFILALVPGLLPLGITIMASSGIGAAC